MPTHERQIENIEYSLQREINELYWAMSLKSFATSLLGIFVPIYVYLYFGRSIPLAMTFYLFQFIGQFLLVPIAARTLHRLGLKKSMAFANPFLGLYLLFLIFAQYGGMAFIVLAVASKIAYFVFYWPAYHTDFSQFVKDEKRGRQIGIDNILSALVTTVGPLLGAVSIAAFGFTPVFVFSALLIIVSAAPLFQSPEVFVKYEYSWLETYKNAISRKNLRATFTFFMEGVESLIALFLFPIFIFIVIGSISTIGWITSFTLLLAVIFMYFIGWITDLKGGQRVVALSSIFHTGTWLVSAFITTPLQYLIFSSVHRLAETANYLPFMSMFYANAKKERRLMDEYIVLREISLCFGRIVISIVLIVGFTYGLTNILFYFSIAALGAFLHRVMR